MQKDLAELGRTVAWTSLFSSGPRNRNPDTSGMEDPQVVRVEAM